MTDDKICVFKDSDLKNFGKSICEINIEEREIKNILIERMIRQVCG